MTANDDLMVRWEPTRDDPFDLRKAGHLFRRAGYGADLQTRRKAVRRGPARTVRSLLGVVRGDRVDEWSDLPIALDSRDALRSFRVWRLLAGGERLAERMSMFWHDHFATSVEKVRDVGAMARHLSVFDRLGLGRFRELVDAVITDPAMIRWLDNDTNVAGHPNENLARELLELFTMGRGSGYTEHDVQEAARALTGHGIRDRVFHLDEHQHDNGVKTVLDETGALRGEDVVRIAVARPETTRYLASRLLAVFVHPQPNADEVAALSARITALDGDVREVLSELLQSRAFFSDRAIRSRIKDPLDWTVGSARLLGLRLAPRELGDVAASLGLEVGAPPSVEGWQGEAAWLNSSTWLRRTNFVTRSLAPAAAASPLAEFADAPDELVDTVFDTVLDGDVPEDAADRVREVVHAAERGDRVRAAISATFLIPEASLA